jgi:phosphoglycolate phosphatase-like HAD superfamily hydrolase
MLFLGDLDGELRRLMADLWKRAGSVSDNRRPPRHPSSCTFEAFPPGQQEALRTSTVCWKRIFGEPIMSENGLAVLLVATMASACGGSAPSSTPPAVAPAATPAAAAAAKTGPLPSWNDGASKKAIVDFVTRVTREGGPDFVPPADRIATFDNDGTLWSEQPVYFQLAFAFDRVKALAPKHPEWTQKQPFKGVLEGDMKAVAASGERGLLEVLAATHVGNTTDEFAAIVTDWIGTARHPTLKRPYTDVVYQPMLEVLAYFRANGFKTFIVSGGGVDFMRPWVERVYGIPPEQVVGSRAKVQYDVRDGRPVLVRLAAIDFIDDKSGKPVGIHQVIGRRPIAAFGNSDGDFEMLEWTTSGPGPRLGMIVHHTDAEREWAYDRTSHIGQLARALDEAPKRGWILADMKQDWVVIYPFQK